MNTWIKATRPQTLRTLLACALASASIAGHAAVINVGTDATWRATNAAPAAGWNTSASFDTSAWQNANVNISQCQPGADCIWYDGQNSATAEAWFRTTFTLADVVSSASLFGGTDDDADIFINGVQVVNDHNGFANNYGPLDVTEYLTSGVNLIAIHAIDNVAVFGQNHNVASRLTINTVDASVSEPGALGLMLVALGGLAALRRRSLAG